MRHFDLCVIGTGSGNSVVDERFADQQVAIVDSGTFGGTCVNVGCIPTKMYVYPADLAALPSEAARLGVDLELRSVHWRQIRDRIFGRIDQMAADGERYRAESANITLFRSESHFVGPRTLDVGNGELITADRFVIAAGSRPVLPDIDGLTSVPAHTSDTIMRLPELPGSMIIVGGGYIAAEFAHVFASYGTAVTLINRSERLLRSHDSDISQRFTELLSRRVDVRLSRQIVRMAPLAGNRVEVLTTDEHGEPERQAADLVLMATGRIPNGDRLGLGAAGIAVDPAGFVVVDDHQLTSAEGVFALGDVCSHRMLKHVANHEARVVQHNLLNPETMIASDHRNVPSGIFSDPQVASVGLTEEEARERGVAYVTATTDYGSTAYGWAMEDRDHFCKVLADPTAGLLIGAHLIGPQATSLIQPLVQAMTFGLTATRMAREQYWPHPAMSEVVENALLALSLD